MLQKKHAVKIILIVLIAGLSLPLILPMSVRLRFGEILDRHETNDPLLYLVETGAPAEKIQRLLENSREKYSPEKLNTPLVFDFADPDGTLSFVRDTTYLQAAVEKKRADAVWLLLEAGCDPNLRHVIIPAISNSDTESVRALMEHGATMENAEPKNSLFLPDGSINSENQPRDRWLMERAKYEHRMFVDPPLLPIVRILAEREPSETEREYLRDVLAVFQAKDTNDDSTAPQTTPSDATP